MHFHTYLQQKMAAHDLSRALLCQQLAIHRSTISLWLACKRVPDHTTIRKVVSHFSTSKRAQKNDLHIIYFGCPDEA